ncbi:MAG: transketolase-like TK C-terminal-containing protein, partial [Acetobacteraceae bacterium]
GSGAPDVILIASGSEVQLALAAREQLGREQIAARVVSMPSWELFEAQDQGFRDSVLPPASGARVTIEEGSTIGWERYAGPFGVVLGMHTFGLSAPIKIVMEHFGFTAEHVIRAAKQTIAQNKGAQNRK